MKHPWYISIWGQGALDDTAVLRRAIELGGHIKTGLELFYDPARNPTNLELLQQAQEIAREVGQRTARKGPALFMPLRAALTGFTHGPELGPLFALIPGSEVRNRFDNARRMAE